jgi:isopentenyl diphosphate isomerase/L-lactate dehydrogenase-like FMN-dependent dehydrogenase
MTTSIINVQDARALARRRLPKIFFDYIDGGAFSERTLHANEEDFALWELEQRVLAVAPERDLRTSFLGRRQALPFMLGPVGFLGLYSGRGEFAAAIAAKSAGIPFCLSTFSIASIAELRATVGGELHFQLYVLDDRRLAEDIIDAARSAGATALYVTVDTTITSVRERDIRNGFRHAQRLSPSLLRSLLARPAWCVEMLRAGIPSVALLKDHPEFGRAVLAQAANLSSRIDRSLCWSDLDWLRRRWPGKLVVKGIMAKEDANAALQRGADAIVVSNHGGRQLDGASSTIARLPEIVESLAGRTEILIDGGFRRGADIVKAIALGASGVMLGRAYAYGLAAAGQSGVSRIIELLTVEIDLTLALMGLDSIDALKTRGASLVRRRAR